MRDVALSIKSYQLQFCSEAAFALDGYSTSAWRGGMGHKLKRVLCRAGATDHCSAGIGRMECGYPRLFELAAFGSKPPSSSLSATRTAGGDIDRHSSRQQTRMKLGGLLGRFTIEGDTEPLRPWLELGVQLHVGKNASMGYGMFGVKSL